MANGSTVPIDWKKVSSFVECGNDGVHVAANLGIHPNTLYDRCKQDLGISWTQFLQEKKAIGVTRLLAKQYEVAMKGNTTMLVWVGKQMAGQRDTFPDESKLPPNEELLKLKAELAKKDYEIILKNKELDAVRKADNQLQRSDGSDQYLAGSNQLGQDTHISSETDTTAS